MLFERGRVEDLEEYITQVSLKPSYCRWAYFSSTSMAAHSVISLRLLQKELNRHAPVFARMTTARMIHQYARPQDRLVKLFKWGVLRTSPRQTRPKPRKQAASTFCELNLSLISSQILLLLPPFQGQQRAAAEVVVSVPGVPGRVRKGPQNLHEGPRLLVARQTRLPRWSSRTGAQRFLVQLFALPFPDSCCSPG